MQPDPITQPTPLMQPAPSLLPSAIPSGTVTFLFTDIEGSTRLWEGQSEAMRVALARHDALLRQAIAGEKGIVFRTVGDAFCAAFATAPQALAAGLSAQIALLSESHAVSESRSESVLLKVRMGLHTGAAEARDGDYYGQPLNRVSRLMTAGHGGQILLSLACQELTRDMLPSGVTLRDLGPHRLKDLSRPEQVFQVVHPLLTADFPPLKSLNNPDLPNNLPQQITSFIGRETEVAEIKSLLEKHRMVTLTGTGGSGKTRLSLQAAADLLDSTSDGVWQVELASLADPGLVPQCIAEVLGVREEPDKPIAKTLIHSLKAKNLLLVLDNCEHVLAACAFLVSDLLRGCPSITLLATSREALGVPGEQTYRVPSLSLPDPKRTYSVEALSQYEAVRLFIDRAGLSHPSFAVTSQNAPAVAQICARLDGIPLAIELAAARVKSLSAEQISTRLDDRFHLLTGGSRTALPRQQTLKAAIDWSYGLLTESEKTLLSRLSVFSGGWTLEAAEAVCAEFPIEPEDVLDLLAGLVDKSLAVYEEDDQGFDRYRLLETVRQYGHDRLEETGEADTVREKHQVFFLKLAEDAELLLAGQEQCFWLDRLETEHDNFRAALNWCFQQESGAEQDKRAEAGLRTSAALGTFWIVRGHYTSGRQYLSKALSKTADLGVGEHQMLVWRGKAFTFAAGLAAEQRDYGVALKLCEQAAALAREAGETTTLAYALRGIGLCRMYQKTDSDNTEIEALFEESLLLFRQLEDQHGITFSLRNLGDLAFFRADYGPAYKYYDQSLTVSRQQGDQHGIAGSLVSLGRVAFTQGELSAAGDLYQEALPLSRRLGDNGAAAGCLLRISEVDLALGNLHEAQASLEEALVISRRLGQQEDMASALAGLGKVSFRHGDDTAARSRHKESLTLRHQIGDAPNIVSSLDDFAQMAYGQAQFDRVAVLRGAIQALRPASSQPPPSAEHSEQQKQTAAACDALSEEAFASAFAAGQAMTLDDAVAYALTAID